MEFRRAILLMIVVLMVLRTGVLPMTVFSSSDGPVFSEYGDFYADFVGSSGSVFLAVTVNDGDGVQTVIGSVSNVSELEWHNVTMSESGSVRHRYYGGYNVPLPEDGHTYESHAKYFANDTLGNWNKSNLTRQYLTNMGLWRAPSTMLTVLGILAGTSVVVAVLIVVLRRRNR